MKIGDVVILNSGGPLMTVIEIPKPAFIKTCWIHDGVAHSLSLSDYAVSAVDGAVGRPSAADFRKFTVSKEILELSLSSAAAASNQNEDKQC